MKRIFLLVFGLHVLSAMGAMACEGQTGATIFEDKFTDDSGGWDLTPGRSDIKPNEMLITLNDSKDVLSVQNLTFNPTEGDYCVEFTLPPPLAPDNNVAVGIEFWATDWRAYYSVQAFSNKIVGLYRDTPNGWITIFAVRDSPLVKIAADSPSTRSLPDPSVVNAVPDALPGKEASDGLNAIRVVAKDGRIATFLNGTKIKEIRAQMPTGALRFGIFAQVDKGLPEGTVIHFKSFKVTTGE